MNKFDAAKILGISGTLDQELTKKAWRCACSKYHPDKGGSTHMMQAVNEAYEALKNFAGEISLDEDSTNFGEELNNAINAIINLDGISIEVCGAWVWVTGETKKHAQALGKKGAGFYYASKKQAWYFRPADFKSRGRGKHSLDEIRAKYGSESVERKSKNKLKAA